MLFRILYIYECNYLNDDAIDLVVNVMDKGMSLNNREGLNKT